jgi:hypothetical protein
MLHNGRTGLLASVCGLAAAIVATPALATSFNYTSLAPHSNSVRDSFATGVNASDTVAGYFYCCASPTISTIWPPGTQFGYVVKKDNTQFTAINASGYATATAYPITDKIGGYVFNTNIVSSSDYTKIALPGKDQVYPLAINASGEVSGYITKSTTSSSAFVANGATATLLKVPGVGKFSYAYSINDSGTVVGKYIAKTDGLTHGFTYNAGTYTSFDPSGSTNTAPAFVNNSGAIGGSFTDSAGTHGFTLVGTTYTTVDFPAATSTSVIGIGPSGEVIGNFVDSTGNTHGFSLQGTTYYQIDEPSGVTTTLTGVSPLGSLIGDYIDSSGYTNAFIAQCPAGDSPCT